ncbi:MAG: sigma-54 dependent transcriptional regulator [Gammaproteobacteria bacterium]
MAAGSSVLIGQSPEIRRLRSYLDKVAASDANVLITGETGTGKECVARYIHEHGARAAQPLASINCSALPDSLLESELFGHERGAFTGAQQRYTGRLRQASGGTLFLDEIGDMSPYAQAKILRAIEAREITPLGGSRSEPIDVRIIAATNVDPESLANGSRLRQDLYYRLNVVRLQLPPLRDRKEDFAALFEHFMRMKLPPGAAVPALNEQTLTRLLGYHWPGNVREVRNFVERLLIDLSGAKEIDVLHLPSEITNAVATPVAEERERVLAALVATHWNKRKAAQALHWSRMTLYRKLAKYQIDSKLRGGF